MSEVVRNAVSACRPPASLFPGESPVRMEQSDSSGRYLVASEDIQEGQVVLRGEPYAAALMSSHRKRVCRRCLSVASSGHHHLSCRGCGQVYWCSETCRDKHMALDQEAASDEPPALTLSVPHPMVCPCLKVLSSSKFDVEMESVLAMLADSAANLALRAQAEAATTPSSSSRPSEGRMSHADFLSLEGHLEEMLERDTKDKQQWRKGARVLMQHIQAMDGGTEAAARFGITETVLLEWASMILCNNFALNYDKVELAQDFPPDGGTAENLPTALMPPVPEDTQLHPQPDDSHSGGVNSEFGEAETRTDTEVVEGRLCCGRVVYPGMSYFNHSCAPNCAVLRSLHTAEARAIKDIRAREEVCISYIDTDLPRSERQKILKRNFHFTCMCPRCQHEAVHGSKKYTFLKSASSKSTKPKPRGRKARISR